MSSDFGLDGLEFHDDPRLRGQPLTSTAPQPEAERVPPPPAPPAPERPVEPEPMAADEVGDSRIERILAGQPWYSQPQTSFPSLVEHARHGEWTLSNGPRYARLAWLWLPAMATRVGAWSILRVYLRANAPRLSEEQPPIRDLIAQARESGRGATVFVCGVYVPVRLGSAIADYAGRTAIAVLLAWLTANALNAVPGVELLIPDFITPQWWWDHISNLWASDPAAAPNSPVAPAQAPAPTTRTSDSPNAASIVGQLLIIVATIAGVVWTKRRNKNTSNTPPWGGGSENR